MPRNTDEAGTARDVLFEFHHIGRSVRVAAIEPGTNTEVVVVGAATAGEAALKRLALRKLNAVLAGRSSV